MNAKNEVRGIDANKPAKSEDLFCYLRNSNYYHSSYESFKNKINHRQISRTTKY